MMKHGDDAHDRRHRLRLLALLSALGAPLALLLWLAPIPIPSSYHNFADTRALLAIANFADVISNAPFLAVGLWGVLGCLRSACNAARLSWLAFFTSIALTGFSSAYYHRAPDTESIFWDQLTIAVSCASLLVAVLTEHLGKSVQARSLAPAIAIAVASVLYADIAQDLRLYIWVQSAPLIAIALLLALFDGAYSHRRYLIYGAAFYGLAKLAEFADRLLFEFSAQTVSGHTLKHLFAAGAVAWLALMLKRRQPQRSASSPAASPKR